MDSLKENQSSYLCQQLKNLCSSIEAFLATTLSSTPLLAHQDDGDCHRPERTFEENIQLKQIVIKLVEAVSVFIPSGNTSTNQVPNQSAPSVPPAAQNESQKGCTRNQPIKCSESMDTFIVEPPSQNHLKAVRSLPQTRNSPTFIVAERKKLRQTASKVPTIKPKLPLVPAAAKQKSDEKLQTAQTRISQLEEEIDSLQRNELLLLAYPDPYGPCKIRPTGDPRRDMQMQIAANQLRMQLLDKQSGHLSRMLHNGRLEISAEKNKSEDELWLPSMVSHCPCSISCSKVSDCHPTRNSTSFHVDWKSQADAVRARVSKSQGKGESKVKPMKSAKISPESVITTRTDSCKRKVTRSSAAVKK